MALVGCERPEPPAHLRIEGGDAERGRRLIERYGCGACHRIDGVQGADGMVGPPLTDYAQRVILAGIAPNVPRTLIPWLMNPPAMDPRTAMPNLGLSAAEARDVATYLYTLGAAGVRVWPPEAIARPDRPQEGGGAAGAPQAVDLDRALEALRATTGRDQSGRP